MTKLAKINDEILTADDFIRYLKFNDKFSSLMDDFMSHKLSVHAAKKQGIQVDEAQVQQRADQYRRIYQLHRRKDMLHYLEELGVSVAEFGDSIEENLLLEKIIAEVHKQQAVADYFTLNAPKYESVELSNIILDSEGIAREVIALLEDEPECFAAMAKEHSIAADTAEKGGALGRVFRETLATEIEAKIFNAKVGDIIGPFTDEDGLIFEIFQVSAKYPAECNADIKKKIQKQIYMRWLESCMSEHNIVIYKNV